MLKIALTYFSIFLFVACQPSKKEKDTAKEKGLLDKWILQNEGRLTRDTDTLISWYKEHGKVDSNFVSVTIVTESNYPSSLGELASLAADSGECIVTTLTFYGDPTMKRRILLAAMDSTCEKHLQAVVLPNDSTETFIYGKSPGTLYWNAQ